MPKSRIILALGFFIALLPVLGFPHSWESFFEVASGLLIVLLSVLISVDRRLTLKAKAEKRAHRKRALVTPVETPAPVEAPREEVVVAPVEAAEPAPEPVIVAPVIRTPRQRRTPDRKLSVRDGDASASGFDVMNTE